MSYFPPTYCPPLYYQTTPWDRLPWGQQLDAAGAPASPVNVNLSPLPGSAQHPFFPLAAIPQQQRAALGDAGRGERMPHNRARQGHRAAEAPGRWGGDRRGRSSADQKFKKQKWDVRNAQGKLVCWHFYRTGVCQLGTKCGFAHDRPNAENNEARANGNRGVPKPELVFVAADDRRICWHWLKKGDCAHGDTCKFAHESAASDRGYENGFTANGERVCWHWQKRGECPQEATCKFAHGYAALPPKRGTRWNHNNKNRDAARGAKPHSAEDQPITAMIETLTLEDGGASAVPAAVQEELG